MKFIFRNHYSHGYSIKFNDKDLTVNVSANTWFHQNNNLYLGYQKGIKPQNQILSLDFNFYSNHNELLEIDVEKHYQTFFITNITIKSATNAFDNKLNQELQIVRNVCNNQKLLEKLVDKIHYNYLNVAGLAFKD